MLPSKPKPISCSSRAPFKQVVFDQITARNSRQETIDDLTWLGARPPIARLFELITPHFARFCKGLF